jgi:hypothetical protein
MVNRMFFCPNHKLEANIAAKKETRGIDRWHIADQAERKEQKKRVVG